jgi:hypothetical protein
MFNSYLSILSLYFGTSAADLEPVLDEQHLLELLEIVNESQPDLSVDRYLS